MNLPLSRSFGWLLAARVGSLTEHQANEPISIVAAELGCVAVEPSDDETALQMTMAGVEASQ